MEAPSVSRLSKQDGLQFKSISERLTDELVFGFVSPIGSGTSTTARCLAEILRESYGYDIEYIKVSDVIKSCAPNLNDYRDVIIPAKGHVRIKRLQDIGNALREKYSHSYIAKKCVEVIVQHRQEHDGFVGEVGKRIPKVRRVAYIIDSLKHPSEILQLREVYGNLFFLIGVFSPDELRSNWLRIKGVPQKELDQMMTRDQDEAVNHGQKVGKAFHQSDYFIRNDGSFDDLNVKIQRLLEIVFGIGIVTPTIDESAMLSAFTSASKSACLSRQVGAAIYSQARELIGVGWNDVPRPTGGLYGTDDSVGDHRCYAWGKGVAKTIGTCHNDYQKEVIYRDIVASLRKNKFLRDKTSNGDVILALRETAIKKLIEFSRAVHAEMEAIVSVARGAKPGIMKGTMYTTAFPCHNCARHIVAAGIDRVVFIEPYPKSLALVLHEDSICGNRLAGDERVVFSQYEGISPSLHIKYFKSGNERKIDGGLKPTQRMKASPLAPVPLDGFSNFEGIVMGTLEEEENRGEQNGDE